MANITIVNLTDREVYIKDLYDSLDPYEVVEMQRSMGELSSMVSLHQAVRDGFVDVTYTMDAVERYLSGLSGGGSTTASNVGTGEGTVFKLKIGDDLQFKSFKAGPNIAVTNDADEITLGVVGAGSSAGSWIVIADVVAQDASPSIGDKVYQDAPRNTVITSCTAYTNDIRVNVRSSHPVVDVNGTQYTFDIDAGGGYYEGLVALTLVGATDVVATIIPPEGGTGASTSVAVAVDTPPVILTLAFTGGYPGTQTELKSGDTFQVTGTTDKACTGLQFVDSGAATAQTIAFASTTTFTVTMIVANRGTVAQLLPAIAKARNAIGSYGPNRSTNFSGAGVNGINVLNLNNLRPTVAIGTITYPPGQGGLKNAEQADVQVIHTDSNSGTFTSPNGDLSIDTPASLSASKLVTRISGSYNVSTPNFSVIVTRSANASTATAQGVVAIANVPATLSVTTAEARLRSGGNDGTLPRDHTITLVSSQNLYSAPTLDAAVGGGTFITPAWVGGPTTYTRTLRVLDTDIKSAYLWTSASATNLSGLVTNVLISGAGYVLGGFMPRRLVFSAFSQSTVMNVPVTDYTKLQAGTWESTGQPAIRTPVMGDLANYLSQFTITATMANPTTLWWNDAAAAASNTSGTAALTNVEELA